MALATEDDVKARLGRPLTESERARLEGLLDEASALVLGYCRRPKGFDAPVPAVVAIVVSRMVARVLTAPTELEGLESTQVGTGPFQRTQRYGADFTSGSPWLSKSDKTMLAGLGGSSAVSVQLGSERTP